MPTAGFVVRSFQTAVSATILPIAAVNAETCTSWMEMATACAAATFSRTAAVVTFYQTDA